MVTQYNHRLPIREIEAEGEVRVREKFEDVGFEGKPIEKEGRRKKKFSPSAPERMQPADIVILAEEPYFEF